MRILHLAAAAGVSAWLLTPVAGAVDPVSAVSDEATLNTCAYASAVSPDDRGVDTRSHVDAWAVPGRLNTQRMMGAVLLLK